MFRLYSLAITLVLVVVGPADLVSGAQATKSPETADREPPTGSGYSGSGLGFLHPLPASEPAICRECRSLLPEVKDHVYVFLVNGLDPLYYANLNGLTTYLHALGFKRAEAMQMTSAVGLGNRIVHIQTHDPQARLVLLGFSAGANCVRSIANGLKKDHVTIDLLIYIGGVTVLDGDYSRPKNVRRIVNITTGWIVKGEIRGTRNEHVPVGHFALPSSARTIEILTEELVTLIGFTPAVPAGAPEKIGTSAESGPGFGTKPARFGHEILPAEGTPSR
jgi:hypothetical protein